MPSVQYTVFWRQEMSDNKSPPPKEKIFTTVKTPQSDGKTLKRKLVSPGSPVDDEERRAERTPKRKRGSVGLESSPLPGIVGLNKTPTNQPRLGTHNVPLSERQQVAMIMRMTDENSQDSSPKHQSAAPHQITPGKRTPGEKKVHKRNERGETQLHIAAKKGDIKQTKKLIKAGADVNVRDFAGWTALHEACNHGCLTVAKQLLKAGANVNVQGLDKDTPLHDASICGHQKLVELLLKHGANPLQANSKGKTAVDVASSQDIVRLLRKEILSSSSDSSSLDDGRSPTSPESTCDDRHTRDDDQSVDINEFALHISTQMSSGYVATTTMARSNNVNVPMSTCFSDVLPLGNEDLPFSAGLYSPTHYGSDINVAKRAVPKSPEGKTNSPRLCLKFRPSDNINSESSDISKDWRRPQYKSYSVTLETGESKGSPANSASSSESDLYDPQFNNGARLKYSLKLGSPHNRNNGEESIISTQSIDRLAADSSSSSFKMFEVNCSGVTSSSVSNSSKPSLVSMQTGPFSPQFEDISDSEHEEPRFNFPLVNEQLGGQPSQQITSDVSRIPVIRTLSVPEPQSKDSMIFAPRNRSSSCVTSSSVNRVWESTADGRERTRHNSAPDKKNVPVADYVSVKQLETPVPDKGDSEAIVQVDHWSSIVSSLSLPSIPKTEQSLPTSLDSLQVTSIHNVSGSPKDESRPNRTFLVSQPESVKTPFKMEFKYTSPKVPPLKIILPTKTTSTLGQADRAGSPFTNQPALPYVVNPSNTVEGETGAGSASQDTSQASSTASSRPSSRASSPSDSRDKVDIGKIVDRLTSQVEEEDKVAKKESELNSELMGTKDNGESDVKTVAESKPEQIEKTSMVLRDRDKGKDVVDNTNIKEKEQTYDKENSEKDTGTKDSKEQKDVRSTTRTLRSHTHMLLQKQQKTGEPQEPKSTCSAQDDTTPDDSQQQSSIQKPEEVDESLTNRKRKLRPKPDTASSDSMPLPPNQYEKPPNPYELFLSIRSQVATRRNNLVIVAPKAPHGYKDFKIVNCSYVLHGNSASRLAVPMLTPPNSVTGPIRDLFVEQEKARYKLRLQHIVEREKLMVSAEQEVIRVHGRAALATINQTLPLGVCTILKDEEIYNIVEAEGRDKNVRSRHNGRQFLSWYHDVVDKFDKIKSYLLLRHHHEAESLFAVQKMDWEWKLKELGLCDSNSTPVIDELHVPMVQVNEEFDLLPV